MTYQGHITHFWVNEKGQELSGITYTDINDANKEFQQAIDSGNYVELDLMWCDPTPTNMECDNHDIHILKSWAKND